MRDIESIQLIFCSQVLDKGQFVSCRRIQYVSKQRFYLCYIILSKKGACSMPQIRSIKDLRNTTEISELCHAANPFLLQKAATVIWCL